MDTQNKVLFLQQELEAAKQENKFLKDTIAIKNQEARGGYELTGNNANDVIELQNALQEANQITEELRTKLANEEAKNVKTSHPEKDQRYVHQREDREGETKDQHRPRQFGRQEQHAIA